MTEWEFTGNVVSWINVLLSQSPVPPFSQAKIEQRGQGSNKRRDLTLLDQSNRPLVTGEVKLPYAADGGTPHNAKVVEDARRKANRAKVAYFFTWNVNECVLWETVPANTLRPNMEFKSWRLPGVSVHKEGHLESPITEHHIKTWLPVFLRDLAQILTGAATIARRSPDEKFVETLESSLSLPINLTVEALREKYGKAGFRRDLDRWMREEQGWTIYTDPEGIADNLTRAAGFACFTLVNKLVFYEALLKRYGAKLPKLDAPGHTTDGEDLRVHLEAFFSDAKKVTGDYETVFGESHRSIGNRIPFYSDWAVPHWRQIIDQIHLFDFSKLDYEVVGGIFERLISPEERHKFGQFYTRVEVVDLINSFAIREGDEKVMDPACGGGTFLVRAYARKKELQIDREHSQLLADLYGVDVSTFATHLTTINLATRDLIDQENYPRIARNDFFDVTPKHAFLSLPVHLEATKLGKTEYREIQIPPLDAIVGNPPYVRQEDIPKTPKGRKNPAKGTKEYYRQIVSQQGGMKLSARSDLHCYFWPHAAHFLKEDGWLCFITSSQWLDVEYGFKLQEWLLQNFEIVAVLESVGEPWFVGARVATTVTIARRQPDEAKRMNSPVKFVQIRRPIAEVLSHDGTTGGAVSAADSFRDEILSLKKDTVNQRYRARRIRQGELWNDGVRLGQLMGKGDIPPSEDPDVQAGKYLGGKWGRYLRGPDFWFEITREYANSLVPLGAIAEVRYGVKTGNDDFFLVRDCSAGCLDKCESDKEFETRYGVARDLVESGEVRIVSCGKGGEELKPIESTYLVPEVHSLMGISGYTVTSDDCDRMLVLINDRDKSPSEPFISKYIKWGESRGYHEATCIKNRTTENKPWYELVGARPAPVLWAKEKQYRFIAPVNPERLIANCRLYEIHPSGNVDDMVCAGVLNSSLAIMSSLQFGRPMGTEGNWSMMVGDTKMMLVPDPSLSNRTVRKRVAESFDMLCSRRARAVLSERRLRRMSIVAKGKEEELDECSELSELDMPDRAELDDAVLEMMGVKKKAERKALLDELYAYLREYFEWTRQKEEQAIVNKKKAKRRGPAKPAELAAQIYQQIQDEEGYLLRQYNPDFMDFSKPFDTFEFPDKGTAETFKDLYMPHGVRFVQGKRVLAKIETTIPEQDALAVLLANAGIRGFVRLPREKQECEYRTEQFGAYVAKRNVRLAELVEERTGDPDIQESVMTALLRMIDS
jgi:hypothetical protein